ncbi:MAG: hypothetical protein JW936_02015 [Sedimentisphaerales bacterium]|nr:hypothetical protein [Sedimentisphaerales bacterium]
MAKGKIDHIGMWTWGGRVFNWKKYLDNMKAVGMDSVVLWHYNAPANAQEIAAYADNLGIEVIWGFNWSWNSPICLDSAEDAAKWRDIVLEIIETQYAPLNASAICFQTGGTEFGGSCRLDCEPCKQAAETGVGPLFVKFVTPIINAVQEAYPYLRIFANVHMGGMKESYQALSQLDRSVPIMWEDLPGPLKHIEIPFAYDWEPENKLQPSTIDMVERLCQLRGPDDEVAFILKGFPCHWGGDDPMLLEDFDLKALDAVYHDKWGEIAAHCEEHLGDVLKVFRTIADSPAKTKTVLLLVEHGLWEYRKYYAAVLITEALTNPHREPQQIIEAAKDRLKEDLLAIEK